MSDDEDRPPTDEEIRELRDRLQASDETFDPRDVARFMSSDSYVSRFFKHVNDIPGDQLDNAEAMTLRSFKFRCAEKVNDIKDEDVEDGLRDKGSLFLHNVDVDGKPLLVFDVKKHTKGSQKMDDMQRTFLYFLERVDRETADGIVTIVFDCAACGLRNMDMEFIQYMINMMKDYYPYNLNYILVIDMPWVLNAAWKIIKTWLPAAAVKKIKFVNKTTVAKFVSEDQRLVAWGGTDDWVYEFEPSKAPAKYSPMQNCLADDELLAIAQSPSLSSSLAEANNNLVSSNDGDVGQTWQTAALAKLADNSEAAVVISPSDELCFVKTANGETVSDLTITNTRGTKIAFKIKTTSPDRYRVRPSLGLLEPDESTKVEILVVSEFAGDSLITVTRDKFLINVYEDLPADWKNELKNMAPFYSCRLKANVKKSLLKLNKAETPAAPAPTPAIKDELSQLVSEMKKMDLARKKALEAFHNDTKQQLKVIQAILAAILTVLVLNMIV